MDVFNGLLNGFSVGLQPINLLFCFFGVLMGTLIGVLPGIGPAGAVAILLPATFRLPPAASIIMLAGIYYGAMYGGSTTSILVNIPGEAASVVTCFDGHQMAKQGRAGAALGIAAFGSFIAGTFGLLGLTFFAVPLARFALEFGPPEYFALLLLGLNLITYLCHGSIVKALMTGTFGITLSCIGLDPVNASPRMTFDLMQLWDGVGLIPIVMGLFGISEVFINIERSQTKEILKTKIRSFLPSTAEWRRCAAPIARGTLLGFFLGLLPGVSAAVCSFLSYTVEKKVSKEPHRFGKGAIEGVAGPESANNAGTSGNFVPLLTLGIPPNVVLALIFGAFMIHGMRPGPFLLADHPDVFWGLVASMYIGNVMLLLLNLPLIPLWVQVLKVPYWILFPLILLFCVIGTYGLNNSVFDVAVAVVFGVVGYLFHKFDFEAAPLVLGLVLGPMLEANFRQSLILSEGSFLIFFTRPIAAIGVGICIILFVTSLIPALGKKKEKYQDLMGDTR